MILYIINIKQLSYLSEYAYIGYQRTFLHIRWAQIKAHQYDNIHTKDDNVYIGLNQGECDPTMAKSLDITKYGRMSFPFQSILR